MRKDPTEFRKRFAAYKNGKSPYKAGRPVEDDEFESFRQTLPDNQKPIGGYRTKRYWELNGKPKTFGEAIGLGMYTLGESGKKGQYGMEIPAWHANSVAYDESTGNYEFMKPNTHDTRWMEDVYGYWSPDNKDFRENYKLQKGVVYDKYVPKKNVYEMPKYDKGKDTEITRIYKPYIDEDGIVTRNVSAELPEVVISGNKKDYGKIAKQERQRQRNIAKAYLKTPSLPNLVNAAEAYWNSLPINNTSAAVNPNITMGAPPDAALGRTSKIKSMYDSVKGFAEKIPGLEYSVVDKFPKIYNRREYYINNLPSNVGNKLKLFYSEDVYPRFTQLGKYNKILTPEQQRLLGRRGDILDDLKFVFYENPKSKMSGFVNNNPNTIYINRSHVDSDKKLFEIIAHETEHYLRRLLKEKSHDLFGMTGHNIQNPLNPSYTDSEISALKRGYLFDTPFIKKNKEFKHTEKRTSEMGAENRRHRANIFYDTGFTGNKLDDYIDNLSNDLLIELMNSGYGKSFQRTFKKDNTLSKNMKNAMKIVPAVSIPIISNNTTSD